MGEVKEEGGEIMEFDITHKVIIESMSSREAKAFIKFLHSEIRRHEQDIEDGRQLIIKVKEIYNV